MVKQIKEAFRNAKQILDNKCEKVSNMMYSQMYFMLQIKRSDEKIRTL